MQALRKARPAAKSTHICMLHHELVDVSIGAGHDLDFQRIR